MKIYGAYENDEYEQCRYVGTVAEMAKEFKCKKESIRHALTRKSKLQGKYKIMVVYEEREDK